MTSSSEMVRCSRTPFVSACFGGNQHGASRTLLTRRGNLSIPHAESARESECWQQALRMQPGRQMYLAGCLGTKKAAFLCLRDAAAKCVIVNQCQINNRVAGSGRSMPRCARNRFWQSGALRVYFEYYISEKESENDMKASRGDFCLVRALQVEAHKSRTPIHPPAAASKHLEGSASDERAISGRFPRPRPPRSPDRRPPSRRRRFLSRTVHLCIRMKVIARHTCARANRPECRRIAQKREWEGRRRQATEYVCDPRLPLCVRVLTFSERLCHFCLIWGSFQQKGEYLFSHAPLEQRSYAWHL